MTITISITILLIHQLLSWLINLKQINISLSDNNSYSLMLPWLWQYDAMFKIPLLLFFAQQSLRVSLFLKLATIYKNIKK